MRKGPVSRRALDPALRDKPANTRRRRCIEVRDLKKLKRAYSYAENESDIQATSADPGTCNGIRVLVAMSAR